MQVSSTASTFFTPIEFIVSRNSSMANKLKQMERHWEYVRVNTHLLDIPVRTNLSEEYSRPKAIKILIFDRTSSKLSSDRNGVW